MRHSAIALVSLFAFACRPGEPRALVLVEASSHAAAIAEDARRFEEREHRTVRILHVSTADEALRLAERGEADVAIVPSNALLEDMKQRKDGVVAGERHEGDEALDVIEVNADMHRMVDARGAHALATFLATK